MINSFGISLKDVEMILLVYKSFVNELTQIYKISVGKLYYSKKKILTCTII